MENDLARNLNYYRPERNRGDLRDRHKEKISLVLKNLSEKLQAEGVPVGKDCRIKMDKEQLLKSKDYILSDLKDFASDQNYVEESRRSWHGDISRNKMNEDKQRQLGDQFEILKTAVLNKFLGQELIIVRTSIYDDAKSSGDNVILNRSTGDLVCAFDDVESSASEKFKDDEKTLLKKNLSGGNSLKYGLKLEKNKNGNIIVLGKAFNIPIFRFSLDETEINEGLESLSPNFKEKKPGEKKVCLTLMLMLFKQIGNLESQKISKETRNKILKLKEIITHLDLNI